jgi:hypothetical protein
MPNHFLKTSGFVFKNKKSGSENDCVISYRKGDDLPAKNRVTQICLIPREEESKEDKRKLEQARKEIEVKEAEAQHHLSRADTLEKEIMEKEAMLA